MIGYLLGYGELLVVLGVKVLEGRNWARITLIVILALSVPAELFSGLHFSGVIRITVAVVMIVLVANRDAGDYCRAVTCR